MRNATLTTILGLFICVTCAARPVNGNTQRSVVEAHAPGTVASVTDDVSFHSVAIRHRGPITFTLETWYGDATHQRTDSQVTLDSGETLRIGTVVNGTELWDYRVEATGTHVLHYTTGVWPDGRTLFTAGHPTDTLARYAQAGCAMSWSSEQAVIAGRAASAVSISPAAQCDGSDFEIPSGVLINNNVNYYHVNSETVADKRAPVLMTVWLDADTTVVLAAQRTTADGVAWDTFRMLSIEYDVMVTADHLQYTPPPDAIVVTD